MQDAEKSVMRCGGLLPQASQSRRCHSRFSPLLKELLADVGVVLTHSGEHEVDTRC